MKIEVLGSGGAFDEYGTCFLVNDHILIDCGIEAVKSLIRDGRAANIKRVLVTHKHQDHINGLEALVYYQRHVSKTEDALTVFCTGDTARHIRTLACFPYSDFLRARSIPCGYDELEPPESACRSYIDGILGADASRYTYGNLGFVGIPVVHQRGEIECFAYLLTDSNGSSVLFTGDIDRPVPLSVSAFSKLSLIFHDMGWEGIPDCPDRVHPFEQEVFDAFGNSDKIIGVHTMRELSHYQRAYRGQVLTVMGQRVATSYSLPA